MSTGIRHTLCLGLLALLLLPAASAQAKTQPTPMPVPQPISAPSLSPHALFPALDAQGFLPEGEFIHADDENGLWLYANATLRVEIIRKFDPELPLTWYEADIWAAPGNLLHTVPAGESWKRRAYANPDVIARNAKAVLALSTDYFQYREQRGLRVGIILRDGQVLHDATLKRDASRFPNLDTMAILPDGSLGVYHNDEWTAQQYLDMGARDVLAFGPWLIRDGVINDTLGKRISSEQPRMAFGMVSPGHFVCVLAEGRMRNVSTGTYLPVMAELLKNKGCTEALNLDGGQTSVISFMGKRINRIGTYNESVNKPRDAIEMLVIGQSEQVPSADPTKKQKK